MFSELISRQEVFNKIAVLYFLLQHTCKRDHFSKVTGLNYEKAWNCTKKNFCTGLFQSS